MTPTERAVLTIVNELGLHARAATRFVQAASRFSSEIFVTKGDREVNGKSIMGMLMLVAAKGSQIAVRAEGSDAREAVAALRTLVEGGFGEER
ncbi:MAG: HPr family phosphocarrier protein [Deltaproteobacteria bacterium]|nr:HPr family phosphocarrier protein [Deltaproteobacteria bacterium]